MQAAAAAGTCLRPGSASTEPAHIPPAVHQLPRAVRHRAVGVLHVVALHPEGARLRPGACARLLVTSPARGCPVAAQCTAQRASRGGKV